MSPTESPLQLVLAVSGLLVGLAALAACLVVVRRSRAELIRAHAEAAGLRADLDRLATRVAAADQPDQQGQPAQRVVRGEDRQDFVITHLGETAQKTARETGRETGQEGAEPPQPARIEGRLFADLVLRETVVRAASLGYGVRRALAPATRHRIRFEMKRETKRARRQRRVDTRTAVREWKARQRGLLDGTGEDAA